MSFTFVEFWVPGAGWGSGMRAPTPSEEAEIRALLDEISLTTVGAGVLAAFSPSNPLKIGMGGVNQAQMLSGSWMALKINLQDQGYYVNPTGMFVQQTKALTLIHEVQHVAGGWHPDPSGDLSYLNGFVDYDGPAIQTQNAYAIEIGRSDLIQVSYGSGVGSELVGMAVGATYTDGFEIDAVRWGRFDDNLGYDELLDTTAGANKIVGSRDLVFGHEGADTINTGAGRDHIYGGIGNDVVDAGEGDDRLIGENGSDSLAGGAGNDLLIGGGLAGLSLSQEDANDTLSGGDGADLLIDEKGENELRGDAGADKFVIKESTNTISGGLGNDLIDLSQVTSGDGPEIRIDGGAGHDWIEGLKDGSKLRLEATGYTAGDIEFVVDRSEQVLIYHAGSPDPGAEDPQRWEYLVDVYIKVGSATIYVGQGFWYEREDWDDQVTGELRDLLAKVTFDGTLLDEAWLSHRQDQVDENGFQAAMKAGQDEHYVARGEASAGADSLVGGSDADEVHGAAGADELSGGGGGDVLDGGTGDDLLSGGAGNDVIHGGSGADVALFDGVVADYAFSRNAAGALVVEHVASGEVDELNGVETLRFSGGGGDVAAASLAPLHGTPGVDEIDGTAPGQALFGHGGGDLLTPVGAGNTLSGGAGIDTVVYAGAPQDYAFARQPDGSIAVVHPAGGGTDVLIDVEYVAFDGDPQTAVRLPALVGDFGTPGDDYVEGTGQADVLYAGAGDDIVDGRGGGDTIDGGAGLDTVVFYGERSDYTISAGGGGVLVTGLGATAALTGVEVLRFGADSAEVIGAADVTGTAGADTLSGGAASEILSPLAGDDQVDGGAGQDLLVLAGALGDYQVLRNADGSVSATHTASGDEKQLQNVEQIWFADGKSLHALSDLVGSFGTLGDDVLNGVNGDERLFGLAGDDAFSSSAGDDTISGGAGVDEMTYYGAAGNFTVAAGSNGDLLVAGAQGEDVLSGVEIIRFFGWPQTALVPGATTGLIGTSQTETLTGGAGRDIISPLAGADTVDGGAGEDLLVLSGSLSDYSFERLADGSIAVVRTAVPETLMLESVEDVWFEGSQEYYGLWELVSPYGTAADDELWGDARDDAIYGLGGADWIDGDAGDDTLIGGAGDDELTGGGGADVFRFEAGGAVVGHDTIHDFSSGDDKIDLTPIDPDAVTAGDQAFAWIGTAAFSNVPGQLRYGLVGDDAVIQADLDGDASADLVITVRWVSSLQASDFLL